MRTRWDFIREINWEDNWSEEYKNVTKDLKYNAIVTFLQRSWSIAGPVIDGALKGVRDVTGTGISKDAFIGFDDVGNYFHGLIDEVRIYEEVLTSAQIKKLYAKGAEKRGLLTKE